MQTSRALEDIRQLTAQIAEYQAAIQVYAQLARQDGATWEQLGEALGVSKQAAQQRFSSCAWAAPAEVKNP